MNLGAYLGICGIYASVTYAVEAIVDPIIESYYKSLGIFIFLYRIRFEVVAVDCVLVAYIGHTRAFLHFINTYN